MPKPARASVKAQLASILLLLAMAAPALWAWFRWAGRDSGPPSFSSLEVTQVNQKIEASKPRCIDFWDGSRVDLEPSAVARVVTLAGERVETRLEAGAARFVVEPQGERQWIASAGSFRLYVQRGAFWMRWREETGTFELRFESGRAELMSACGHTAQTLSERTIVQLICLQKVEAKPIDAAKHAEAHSHGAHAHAPATGLPPGVEAAGAPSVPPKPWKELVSEGNYRDAFASLQRLPPERQCRDLAADDLLQASDLAGLLHEVKHATRLLECVRSRFAGEESAANAAFRLGKLLLQSRPDQAMAWFSVYQNERPHGPFVGEAMGREMEARLRGGDPAGARRVATKYLERFPEGPFVPQANAILNR